MISRGGRSQETDLGAFLRLGIPVTAVPAPFWLDERVDRRVASLCFTEPAPSVSGRILIRPAPRRPATANLTATSALFLNRRALHRTIGTVDAAVAGFWSKHLFAVLALVVELTGVGRHGFLLGESTMWADQDRFESHCRHADYLRGVDGKPAFVVALTRAATFALLASYFTVAVLEG